MRRWKPLGDLLTDARRPHDLQENPAMATPTARNSTLNFPAGEVGTSYRWPGGQLRVHTSRGLVGGIYDIRAANEFNLSGVAPTSAKPLCEPDLYEAKILKSATPPRNWA
jgi:hypothetical protein